MRRGITIAEPEILNEIRERATWRVRKKMHSNDFDVKTDVTAHAFAPVVTENSVRSENTGVPISREIMVAITMSSLFVGLFA